MAKIIFVLTFMSFILQGCQTEHSNKKAQYGGVLRWGTCHKPTPINPIYTSTSVSMPLQDLIFNKLVRINAKGEVEPDLAWKWEVSDGGLVYIFYLRKGVYFHDGVECTAEDVKFTYGAIMAGAHDSPFKADFSYVTDVEVIDKYRVKITLKKPSVFFIYNLVKEICPAHLLQGEGERMENIGIHPVGTGPFKFKQWTEDSGIALEYNP